jgi:hypothetical protein
MQGREDLIDQFKKGSLNPLGKRWLRSANASHPTIRV